MARCTSADTSTGFLSWNALGASAKPFAGANVAPARITATALSFPRIKRPALPGEQNISRRSLSERPVQPVHPELRVIRQQSGYRIVTAGSILACQRCGRRPLPATPSASPAHLSACHALAMSDGAEHPKRTLPSVTSIHGRLGEQGAPSKALRSLTPSP